MGTENDWSDTEYDPCRRATWGEFKRMAEEAGATDDTVIDFFDVKPLIYTTKDGEEFDFYVVVGDDGMMEAC